jgi:RNA polymerase sigma factor (sigma-70 family)
LLDDARVLDDLRTTMLHIASSRYRIRGADAEDVVQSAFVTYLEVGHRYRPAEHPAVVVGILRKKCLERIDRGARERRRFLRYCTTPDAARENRWLRPVPAAREGCALEALARRETDRGISAALSELRPSSRELVTLIAVDGAGRRELIARFNVNKNTFDSRLRSCRTELRGLLAEYGATA